MKKEIENIKTRNKRVELDKAWENSKTRKLIIFLMTYIIIGVFLVLIKVPNPWLNAFVPALGFLLSTLTMPYFKKAWIKNLAS